MGDSRRNWPFENLQTLYISKTCLLGLPESIWSIKTLRHVAVKLFGVFLWSLPAPSDDLNLVNLRTLQTPCLEHTQGESYSFPNLCVLSLRKSYSWHPITALLKNKSLVKLVDLSIAGSDFPLDVVHMRHFLFFEHLQCLKLNGRWSQDVGLSAHLFPFRLTKLVLEECGFTKDPMPELGKLENLKILELLFRAYEGRQMTCPAGGFPQLRELRVSQQPVVEDLNIEEGTMPVLKKLELAYLPRLKRIPDLQHLTKLEEFVWNRLSFSEGEIQMMRHENQHKLNHIRVVIINCLIGM